MILYKLAVRVCVCVCVCVCAKVSYIASLDDEFAWVSQMFVSQRVTMQSSVLSLNIACNYCSNHIVATLLFDMNESY